MFIHTVHDVDACVVCLLLFTVLSDQKKEQKMYACYVAQLCV